MAEAGEFDRAIEVAEKIKNSYPRSLALASIASKLARAGEFDRAKEVFDRAIEVAERIKYGWWRSKALASIASKLANASAIPILIDKAKEYERKGEIEKAIEIYEYIEDERAEELKKIVELKQLISKYPGISEDIKEKFEEGGDVDALLVTLKQRINKYKKAKSEVEKLRREIEGLNHKDLKEPIKLFETGDYKGCLKSIEKVRAILPEIKSKVEIAKELKQLTNRYPHLSEDIKPELEKFEEDYNVDVQTLLNTLKQRINKYEELRNRLNELESRIKSVKHITIPEEISEKMESAKSTKSLEELEKTVSEMERKINEILNSKPEIKVETPEEISHGWNQFKVKIKNEGYAHAYDVEVSISGDVNAMPVEPLTVKGLESTTVELPLKPTETGTIPLEISIKYRDVKNNEFVENSVVWVEVKDEKEVKPQVEGITPAEFTPKPTTPKTLPSELSHRYVEAEFVGKGGFARVFKARRKDGRLVAVKIPVSLDEATGKSFIRELTNWTKLDHPNVVKVYDYNILPIPYFEMELCDCSLADLPKPLNPEKASWLIFNICEALKYAHKQGIIHRDLKPQNIMLKDGIPKVSDWGLSKVMTESSSSRTAFTPLYAAPEQISGDRKDERTDIWQLGVIFYELVTGELPFKGDNIIEVGMAIATKQPTFPSQINPEAKEVESIIMKCLEKDKSKRYQSVSELQKDLAKYLGVRYTKSLKASVSQHNMKRSAHYCGELLVINMKVGEIVQAYKYATDLVNYADGEIKSIAEELCKQLKARVDAGINEIPDELIKKAELIAHKVRLGFK